MTEYFIRTNDEKYIDIITAKDKESAIKLFKEKHSLSRYKNFVCIPSKYIFN